LHRKRGGKAEQEHRSSISRTHKTRAEIQDQLPRPKPHRGERYHIGNEDEGRQLQLVFCPGDENAWKAITELTKRRKRPPQLGGLLMTQGGDPLFAVGRFVTNFRLPISDLPRATGEPLGTKKKRFCFQYTWFSWRRGMATAKKNLNQTLSESPPTSRLYVLSTEAHWITRTTRGQKLGRLPKRPSASALNQAPRTPEYSHPRADNRGHGKKTIRQLADLASSSPP